MSFTKPANAVLAVVAAALATSASSATQAATLAGLQDGKSIVWIDTEQKKVTGSVKLDGGASLVGFDVRPADGKLYGVTPDGAIVTIDVKTGKWEKKSQLTEALPRGATFSVDFNPVDYAAIARGFGFQARQVVDPDDVRPAIQEALADGRPYFLDVVTESQITETPPVAAWVEAEAKRGERLAGTVPLERD